MISRGFPVATSSGVCRTSELSFPTTSSAVYPYIRRAPSFQRRIFPSRSLPMREYSVEDSRILLTNSTACCAVAKMELSKRFDLITLTPISFVPTRRQQISWARSLARRKTGRAADTLRREPIHDVSARMGRISLEGRLNCYCVARSQEPLVLRRPCVLGRHRGEVASLYPRESWIARTPCLRCRISSRSAKGDPHRCGLARPPFPMNLSGSTLQRTYRGDGYWDVSPQFCQRRMQEHA